MKTKNIISLFLFSAFTFAGCVDMDTYPEGDITTPDQKEDVIESQPQKVEAGVNAVFTEFSTYMKVLPDLGRHNDIGYPAVMLFTDHNGADMVSADNGYNWMGNNMAFDDRIFTSNEAQITWGTIYGQIYAANNVLKVAGVEVDDPTLQYYVAQALATRAFDYWVLAQLYQFNYATHQSDPCVPIITETNAETASIEGCKRSTVEETYTQILSDISKAIEYLDNSTMKRKNNRYISKEVAYGIRARVNLTMQNWTAAAEDAKKAIAGSNAPYSIDAVSKPAFNAASEWMWGIMVAETDAVVTSGIVNWPSHMGSLNYGYCWFGGGRQINKILWNEIPETDVRKGWWIDEDLKSKNLNEDQAALIEVYYGPYTQVKFAPYKNEIETSTNANDIPLMRVEEMYLIQAEAEAMSGNTGAAKATLESFVQTYRNPQYVCKATSPEGIQEEVYFQRRIELWGEGMSWFDVMRLNKGVDRRGAGYPDPTSVFNIPAGDPILLWRLPEKEIQANPLLEDSDNNEVTALPTPVADID